MIKQIPGYSSYSVTDDGRVWSHRLRSGWLAPSVDRNGYIRFHMEGDNGKRKGMYIHQLVALTYIPNPDGKPNVNHKDFNKANNSVSNLEWCTHLENIRHDWSAGRRKALPGGTSSKYSLALVDELRSLYDSGLHTQTELSRRFGVPQSTVHVIVRHKHWRGM